MIDTGAPSRRSLKAVVDEVIARRVRGEEFTDDDVVRSHPQLMPQLEHELRKVRRVEEARRAAVGDDSSAGDANVRDDQDDDDGAVAEGATPDAAPRSPA